MPIPLTINIQLNSQEIAQQDNGKLRASVGIIRWKITLLNYHHQLRIYHRIIIHVNLY